MVLTQKKKKTHLLATAIGVSFFCFPGSQDPDVAPSPELFPEEEQGRSPGHIRFVELLTHAAMEIGRAFHHRNTMALLDLLGFSDIQVGRHGFTNFGLLGDCFEVVRYEHEVCLGLMLPTETSYEIYGFENAMEDILVDYPKLQGFYSGQDDVFKLRIWLSNENSNQFGATLRLGIETLSSVRVKLEEVMLDCVFSAVEPLFENALSFEDDDDEY